ncbi:golgin subfamily A member 3 [Octopus bimaculoides]|uniref:Uncharacterized protein n=1 Tax=Octopus bimaculoides TaxID=37653 RepID=A0A0L8HB00_OCTBM|nr:golgin subfamily A member 3 [Octopus bimaculoides]XP_052832982.1 golgin subfamily A member 3 [Octopus bimaculoides]|eukprot:XP_014774255.1 PREDICTED: golgin subfamily A member 3-like [Octopus bimaculoides]
MEPFNFTFEQINFEHELQLPPDVEQVQQNFDSFNNVIHYDLDFVNDFTSSPSSSAVLQSYGIPETVKRNPVEQRLCQSSEGNPCDTRVHYVWSEKRLSPQGNDHLVNPFINFSELESDKPSSINDPTTTADDISTLIKVSAITKTVNSQLRSRDNRPKFTIPKRKMATTEVSPSTLAHVPQPATTTAQRTTNTTPFENSNAFETVAEALHLQWSVIGDKNVTPASPEVVAQIVAEAEKRLKANNIQPAPLSESFSSKTNSETSSDIPQNLIPGLNSDSQSLKMSFERTPRLDSLYSNDSHSLMSSGESTEILPTDVSKTDKDLAKVIPSTKGKIIIPATNITLTTEKTSWFNSGPKFMSDSETSPRDREQVKPKSKKKGKPKNKSASKDFTEENDGLSPSASTTSSVVSSSMEQISREPSQENGLSEGDKTDEVASVKSSSAQFSDCDEDYNYEDDSTAEDFLKSLPPVKAIELESFLKRFQNGRHSPPVRERSFTPSDSGRDTARFSPLLDSVTGASHDQKYPFQNTDISDRLGSVPGSVELPEKDVSSLPSKLSTTTKPKIVLPDPGPLFKNAMKPFTERKSKAYVEVSSPATGKPEETNLNTVLKEKAKLEGQLEVLSAEAEIALQERAELQAQVASLDQKLQLFNNSESDVKQNALKADIKSLKENRVYLEQCLEDTQKLLEEKIDAAKHHEEELKLTQELQDKQNINVRELSDSLNARDVTIQALKNKVAELYVEVQTALQKKMLSDTYARNAKSDLSAITSTKQWYHEQLQMANKVRSELQKELTALHAQVSSQGIISERLKADTARLHQLLSETRQKAVLEKETLARQLENIQADMLERETAFQEIQRERHLIEETFDSKILSVEEEKSKIATLLQTTVDLEAQLEKSQNNVKKKQIQIFSLETEQASLMKNLMVTEGKLTEKDKISEELQQKLIDVESSLSAFQTEVSRKNQEVLKLKEEKAAVEISLVAASEEKKIFDSSLETLRGDLSKVEKSFWQMKQELNNRVAELEQVKVDRDRIKLELEESQKTLSNLPEKELQEDKENLVEHSQKIEKKNEALTKDLNDLRGQFTELNDRYLHEVHEKEAVQNLLENVQKNLDLVNVELEKEKERPSSEEQNLENSEKLLQLETENKTLKAEMKSIEKKWQNNLTKQKARSARLSTDLNAVKDELMERQKAYDSNTELLSSKLREMVSSKEALQNEHDMLKRKFEFGMLEQQDHMKVELQTLAGELELVTSQKHQAESQLTELEIATKQQIDQYVAQVVVMGEQLQQLVNEKEEVEREASSKDYQFQLELEKERGRLTGLQQSNTTLKNHVAELEEALARRESSLVELQTQFSETLKNQDCNDSDFSNRLQELEQMLAHEKSNQRELRKQIGVKIKENKNLKRQQKALATEQEQLQGSFEQKALQCDATADELQRKKEELSQVQSSLQNVQHVNQTLNAQIERLQRNLSDNQDRNPVILEQLESLQWKLQQKNSEIESVRHQLTLSEERHDLEQENLKKTLQNNQQELEALRGELTASRQEKLNQQAKVSELRSALKTSIHQHKISKKVSSKLKSSPKRTLVNSENLTAEASIEPESTQPVTEGACSPNCRDVGTQMDEDTKETILALAGEPFDIEALEQLLQDTTVQALESKPLDDLQSCLSSLRAQISGLEKQIDDHSAAIQNSGETWRDVETQVVELQQVVQTVTNTTSCPTLTTTVADTSEATY